MTKPTALVVAVTCDGGIGKNGQLPWPKIPADLKHLRVVTETVKTPGLINAVIMGRKTYESLPESMRPLKNRLNVVISTSTRQQDYPNGVLVYSTLRAAVDALNYDHNSIVETIFFLGGQRIYEASIKEGLCHKAIITRIGVDTWECDTKFPLELITNSKDWQPISISKTHSHEGIPFDFAEFALVAHQTPHAVHNAEHQEYQYLRLIDKIIQTGFKQDDRTGVGTLSLFGEMMRFDLKSSFPLLTTKRVFWKGVVEELLWFVKGDTNANHLAAKGVRIWDGNGSLEFLKSRGLGHREQGDLGPVYGFQWRHFGAKYETMHSDYSNKGFDQLLDCINKIKHNPTDRRIIMSAWNPADLNEMALPPCHMFCQFYVANGELSCAMYQRSCDMGLGVPFNIASYSLLTCMMAQVCGLKPGEFIHNLGNAHVYLNHVEPLKEQLQRTPRPFPILKINPSVTDIDGFTAEDFTLIGYNPLAKIAMDMAV
jgi:dihydrofolate reductase / thymidylate synthase